MTPVDSRRHEISRLKRQIAYYCGVIARAISRERIQSADALIRRHERLLHEVQAAARRGALDD